MAKATKAKSKPARKIEFVKKVIRELEQIHSDAKLDLDFTNPLELLIALILAAQARDDLVNQVTVELFKKYRTAEDYARIPLEKLQEQLRKVNFYRNKARSLHNCCTEIVKRFNGRIPERLEDLLRRRHDGERARELEGRAVDEGAGRRRDLRFPGATG